MSFFLSRLTHTCDVIRATESSNPFGNASKVYDNTVEAGVACRLIEKTEKAYSDEQAAFIVQTAKVLIFGPDTDVDERDRVTNLTVGGITDTTTYEVRQVLTRHGRGGVPHHKSARIEAI